MTSEEIVVEKYKIETIRHAANAIFNKLNEAHYFHGTPQGTEALLDAQSLANVIVRADYAAEKIGRRPTSRELDEWLQDAKTFLANNPAQP